MNYNLKRWWIIIPKPFWIRLKLLYIPLYIIRLLTIRIRADPHYERTVQPVMEFLSPKIDKFVYNLLTKLSLWLIFLSFAKASGKERFLVRNSQDNWLSLFSLTLKDCYNTLPAILPLSAGSHFYNLKNEDYLAWLDRSFFPGLQFQH